MEYELECIQDLRFQSTYVKDVILVPLPDGEEVVFLCDTYGFVACVNLKTSDSSSFSLIGHRISSLLHLNDNYVLSAGMNGIFHIFSLRAISDGKRLNRTLLKCWSDKFGKIEEHKTPMSNTRSLCKLTDTTFLAGDFLGKIFLFKFTDSNAETKQPIFNPLHIFESHEERVVCLLNLKNEYFFSAGGLSIDFRIRRWRIEGLREEKLKPVLFRPKHRYRIVSLSFFNHRKDMIISSAFNDHMIIWNIDGTIQREIRIKNEVFLSLALLPPRFQPDQRNSSIFLLGSQKGGVHLKTLGLDRQSRNEDLCEKSVVHQNWVNKFAFARKSHETEIVFVTCSDDHLVKKWKLRVGKKKKKKKKSENIVEMISERNPNANGKKMSLREKRREELREISLRYLSEKREMTREGFFGLERRKRDGGVLRKTVEERREVYWGKVEELKNWKSKLEKLENEIRI